MNKNKFYLGDGVYGAYEDCHIILTAENGLFVTDRIILEPEVLSNFQAYVNYIKNHPKENHD